MSDGFLSLLERVPTPETAPYDDPRAEIEIIAARVSDSEGQESGLLITGVVTSVVQGARRYWSVLAAPCGLDELDEGHFQGETVREMLLTNHDGMWLLVDQAAAEAADDGAALSPLVIQSAHLAASVATSIRGCSDHLN